MKYSIDISNQIFTQTLFKWLLPTVNQSGIDHVIHDLQDTLQAVINGVTNTKDVLTETAIKQGIPYVIPVFDVQNVISMDIPEKLLREYQTFSVWSKRFYFQSQLDDSLILPSGNDSMVDLDTTNDRWGDIENYVWSICKRIFL